MSRWSQLIAGRSPRHAERMTFAERLQQCQEALRAPPLSDEEKREFDALRAREMARAEHRRNPQPQLELAA